MLDAKILTFLEVARLGSYTRAAECLHLTQPAVTQQIHRLEEHFGRRLVDTRGRGVRRNVPLLIRIIVIIITSVRENCKGTKGAFALNFY